MWDKRAQYLENHDGDSVRMVLDQGFFDTKTIDVRLLGVYAPELNQPGGLEVKKFIEEWFLLNDNGTRWPFIVTTHRMKRADREQKTFDRYVCTVTDLAITKNLNLDVMDFVFDNNYGPGMTTGRRRRQR